MSPQSLKFFGTKVDIVSQAQLRKELQQFYDRPVTRVSVELIASIVVVIVFALFALRPTLLTMTELRAEIQQKKTLQEDLRQKIAALSTAQSEWTVNEQKINQLQRAFFENPSLEQVMLYLEYLSRQEGVSIQSIVPPDSIAIALEFEPVEILNANLSRHQAHITLEGEYESIMSFLQRIEQMQPLFTVDRVAIQVNEDSDSPWTMAGRVTLGLYVYQKGGVITAEEAAAAGMKAAPNPAVEDKL